MVLHVLAFRQMLERLSAPSGLLIFAMPSRGLSPAPTPHHMEGCAFDINHEQHRYEIDRLGDPGGKLSLTTDKLWLSKPFWFSCRICSVNHFKCWHKKNRERTANILSRCFIYSTGQEVGFFFCLFRRLANMCNTLSKAIHSRNIVGINVFLLDASHRESCYNWRYCNTTRRKNNVYFLYLCLLSWFWRIFFFLFLQSCTTALCGMNLTTQMQK